MTAPGWTSPNRLAQWTRALLAAGIALTAVAVISDLMQLDLISRAATDTITDAEASANDSRQQVIGILQVILYLGTAVSFLVWVRRCHCNLSALGNSGLKY